MIPANLLRRIRNDLPMQITIAALGNEAPPSKYSEGYFRFLCPNCGEMKATVNPRNNLAHCFCCGQNLNNIDLLIQLGFNFPSAARLLEQWLLRYQTQQAQKNNPTPSTPPK
jgi:DNA primase